MSSSTAVQTMDALRDGAAQRSQQESMRLPSLTTTVPKEYVHRASLAEVFLTGCVKTGEDTFTLTGQWPRAHLYFNGPDGRSHDHLQAVETVRQAGIFLAHAEYHIPLGHHFVMRDISATTHPEHLGIGHTPSDLTIDTTFTRNRRDTVLGVDITIRRDGHVVATGDGHFSCVSPAAYRRLRGPALTSSIDYHPIGQSPADYGRALPGDVVLAPTDRPGVWWLNPDPSHPVLFDHGGDHMPGMVLLEAARQAACALQDPGTSILPTTTVNHFHHYADFDAPCFVEATAQPATRPGTFAALVTGHQSGRHIFTTHITGRRTTTPHTHPGQPRTHALAAAFSV
ncbi:ScbA/BarX family gamma-butyrolactone biosynthesis protein [Streptomyces sp. NPDC017979]|uniref:ScbA/BarX family gamma-butyrolactone biosynthesis protein n=1 Tax=Streptomyces sp. NPDC017979 TaxID=3365024 RepID=UPI0037BA55B8